MLINPAAKKKSSILKILGVSGLIVALCLCVIFIVIGNIAKTSDENMILKIHLKKYGVAGFEEDIPTSTLIRNFSLNFFDLIKGRKEVDNLVFDIKFKQFEKLEDNIDLAVTSGVINESIFESVKSNIRVPGKKLRAEVRLTGDTLDHLSTHKRSMLVNIKNDNFKGIREFSLIGPFIKNYQSSYLINSAMRFRDVLAPRDDFVNVLLNGSNIGLMYLEERYEEQFTEESKRPYGPIIDFNKNTNQWSFHDNEMFWGKDKNLGYIYSILENAYDNPSSYEDLIDEERWAEYVAVIFLFKCSNGNIRENQSFYFNPIDKTLEPISSKNFCSEADSKRPLGFLPYEHEIFYKLLSIDSFKTSVIKKLNWWLNHENAHQFLNDLNDKQELIQSLLATEAPFLGEFKISNDHLGKTINWIQNMHIPVAELQKNKRKTDKDLSKYDGGIPLVYVRRKDNSYVINVNKFDEQKYELKEFKISTIDDVFTIPFSGADSLSHVQKKTDSIITDHIDGFNYSYIDKRDIRKTFTFKANLGYTTAAKSIFVASSFSSLSKYFKIDHDKKEFFVKENNQLVIEELLILPAGYDLVLGPSSLLQFKKDAGIIIRGGVNVNGLKNNEVVLQSYQGEKWAGVLILAAGEPVNINHLVMDGGSGVFNGFVYRGAFTINKAEFMIRNSVFQNNLSEDTLNIVQSKGDIENSTILNSRSDGLDIDFGEVTITSSKFINIGSQTGADAIDMSGSNVKITDCSIENTTDKGISVGEGSYAEISDLSINMALVGVVTKDSSRVIANKMFFRDIQFADTMTYRKKEHYGGGMLNLTGLDSTLNNHIVQDNSVAFVDDKKHKTVNINIDALYADMMKSVK